MADCSYFTPCGYFKKPKPWKKVSDVRKICCDDLSQKQLNLSLICRRLTVSRGPDLLDAVSSKRTIKRSKVLHSTPPFLIRNCVSGHKCFDCYAQKLRKWAIEHSLDPNRIDNNQRAPAIGVSYVHDTSSCGSDVSEAALLRAFYTIWHVGQLSRKSPKSVEESRALLEEFSQSERVEQSVNVTPKGGIKVEVINDRTKLSKKAHQTLSKWARLTANNEDGYESGYEDDPVEVWNRAVERAKYRNENISASEVTAPQKTNAHEDHPDESTNEIPIRRRSSRLLNISNR